MGGRLRAANKVPTFTANDFVLLKHRLHVEESNSEAVAEQQQFLETSGLCGSVSTIFLAASNKSRSRDLRAWKR